MLCSRTFANVQGVSRVEVVAEMFKPTYSLWKHALIGETGATCHPAALGLKVKGKNETKKLTIDASAYC